MERQVRSDEANGSKLGEPPVWLSKRAKAAWHEIGAGLGDSVYAVDGLALGLMCTALATAQDAAEDLAVRGALIQSRDRGLVKSPSLQILRDAGSTFRAFAEAFGLTPGARKRLGIDLSDEFGSDLID
jgi:P27 family predicted phage terminase small subunit